MRAERTRRERLLTFLLLPAVVISVLVLSVGSFRASFQLDTLRDQAVLEASLELANARASSLDQMIIEQDNVVRTEARVDVLETVGASWLAVADRQTPTVRAVLVVDVTDGQRDVLVFASRAPGVADDQFRRLLLYEIWPDLKTFEGPKGELRHLHRSYRGQNYLLSYWRAQHAEREYLVLAWHDVPRIVHDYLPALYGEKDGPNRVNVVDSKGRIIFGPPLSGGAFTVGIPFHTTLYKWRLNVALTTAEQLVERAERRLLLEIGLAALSALVVIAGSALILTAAARERRLANLKSEFVANVSHELKTPLSLIRMFAELLQSGRADDDQKRAKYQQIILAESERLSALIENVLDFARVERGGKTYEFAEADLTEVVLHAVEACRARLEREGMVIQFEPPKDAIVGKVDQRALEVAVINLIDNASKYGPQGQWVGVSIARLTADEVEIVVRDRGEGIPVEDRTRIFERFTRREEHGRVRGSGIGLALVQSIAVAHRGKAWVTPNSPKGSAFHVRLRLR
ncbi:MAG: hypothetical protein RJA70_2367 [Pseudomonadota bacterium]|jgi:two-component system phosphate regulon sensor histidine kinase PhoR